MSEEFKRFHCESNIAVLQHESYQLIYMCTVVYCLKELQMWGYSTVIISYYTGSQGL